jgi:hypothetical protein
MMEADGRETELRRQVRALQEELAAKRKECEYWEREEKNYKAIAAGLRSEINIIESRLREKDGAAEEIRRGVHTRNEALVGEEAALDNAREAGLMREGTEGQILRMEGLTAALKAAEQGPEAMIDDQEAPLPGVRAIPPVRTLAKREHIPSLAKREYWLYSLCCAEEGYSMIGMFRDALEWNGAAVVYAKDRHRGLSGETDVEQAVRAAIDKTKETKPAFEKEVLEAYRAAHWKGEMGLRQAVLDALGWWD